MSGHQVDVASAPSTPLRAAPNAASTLECARGGMWVAITAVAEPGNATAPENGSVAPATGGAVGALAAPAGMSATKGIDAGGEQEVSRHIWTLTEPVI